MNGRFLLAFAAALGLASPAMAHGESQAGHAHGAATFDAGQPGAGVGVTRRIGVVAREDDGKMTFTPSRIGLRNGENVEFVVRNEGQLEHEFVLGSAIENASHAAMMDVMPDMKHVEPNVVRIAPRNEARLIWTFSKAGEFEFACLIPGHYDAGMKGQAIVD